MELVVIVLYSGWSVEHRCQLTNASLSVQYLSAQAFAAQAAWHNLSTPATVSIIYVWLTLTASGRDGPNYPLAQTRDARWRPVRSEPFFHIGCLTKMASLDGHSAGMARSITGSVLFQAFSTQSPEAMLRTRSHGNGTAHMRMIYPADHRIIIIK
ncbi:uncharacterized protein LAESUDRAFT_134254 [Laetiporus sulphureus 93-53]|uniref:Uncharacterized protein n=1 Tax=Laetiporus sulphureus 93-53 TaxID=1314785 RepID=A0A165EIA9_9APHY|nr:uncharacterized protein LAESUDRAFT_134254 [Laetiporus sulphureus 93-53]KZT07110.1 hypothetical protein LAESUDRAFT_134254 [Laetiporus sulphureus 93-53]